MRRLGLIAVMGLASCAALFDPAEGEDSQGGSEPEPWSAQVLEGTHHVGTETVADWPPPEGACIEGEFVLDDLPVDSETGQTAPYVALSFQHAGDRDGLIEVNGSTVFTRVSWRDIAATAFADVLVDITVCSIYSAFPGDPDCDPITVDVETTSVSRGLSTDLLDIGANTYRVCATESDFLIASGIRLSESSRSDDGGDTDTDTDTGLDTDAGMHTDSSASTGNGDDTDTG